MESENNDDLYRLRHSLAHVLAQAVLQIRPDSKLAFGPPIDTGCYYDFLFETPVSSDDFKDIQTRMRKIIKEKQEFTASTRSADEALAYLREQGESFKVEYCQELIEGGETEIGFYKNGPFEDMCAGPHLEHTGQIPQDCFKLDSVAGAYWRGDEKNAQLTRIYCLAFPSKEELKDHIERRKLALQRDHRKLGKELELFYFSDIVGPGLPLWTPNGTAIREELESLAKETEKLHGYHRVSTPILAKEKLFLTSGHLPYFAEDMFPPIEAEEGKYYLKAMNCPHHHQIYDMRPRSYRELPLRLAEYGNCFRHESSGALNGLVRVRAMCMNDAHIYCSVDQLKEELIDSFQMAIRYYNMFRLDGVKVRVSTHDESKPEKFVDNPELWKFSEEVLEDVVKELEIEYEVVPGEAAFYGPKIDFQARTLLGKEETISTSQLDFASPIKFDLNFIGEDGEQHRPYIIHRAPLGTHERFIAFLIEHFGGAFPTWLAPVQVRIVPVAEAFQEYAKQIQDELNSKLYRVECDLSTNSFGKKIREAVTRKIPNILIIGAQELEANSVTLRRYCVEEQLTLTKDDFLARMDNLVSNRLMDNFPDAEIA